MNSSIFLDKIKFTLNSTEKTPFRVNNPNVGIDI